MSYVEVETGRYVKRWAFWNPATWSIPKLYWDAWSQEQRLHAICRQLEKVIKYADYLGVNVDDIAARLKAIEEGQLDPIIEAAIEAWFEENEPAISAAITALSDALPISAFDGDNTVKDALDVIGADNWVTTQRISDNAVTTSKIADKAITTEKMEPLSLTPDIDGNYLKTTNIIPICYGFLDGTNVKGNYGHAGAICERNGTQYIISDKYQQTTDNAFIQTCNIEQGTRANDSRETKLGHTNSIATNGSIFVVAPLWEWVGGSHVDTNSLYVLTGIGNYDRSITAPEQCFAVSYDWIESKWYAIGYSGKIYTFNPVDDTFEEVDNVSLAGMGVLQDAAVYDSVVYISNVVGDLFTFSLATHTYNYAKICDFDASGLYRLGEIDGMEFNDRGILLCVFDATNGEELVDNIFVCGLPVNENTKLFSEYEIELDVTNSTYTQYVTPSSTDLHVYQNVSIRNNFLGKKYNIFEFTENATIDFLYAIHDVVIAGGNHTITINDMRIRSATVMFTNGTFVLNKPIQNYNPGAIVKFQVSTTVQLAASVASWFTSGTWGTILFLSGTYPDNKPMWPNAAKIPNANGYWTAGNWY